MSVLEKLLEPIEGDNPSGSDMAGVPEYDAVLTTFDADFRYAARLDERDSSVADPKTYDWPSLLTSIEALSGQTKDLELAVCYTRCGVVLGDIEIVERGLKFIVGLLENFWDTFHPYDEDGATFALRSGRFQDLVVYAAFPLPFLKMPIATEGRKALTGEQIVDAHKNGAASQDYPDVRSFLDDWSEESKVALLATLDSIAESFEKMQAIMSDKEGSDPPNFEEVKKVVASLREGYAALAGLEVEVEEEIEEEGAVNGSGGKAFTGKIQSRDDVVRALTEIEKYYEMAEPGHPVKVSLARMRGWVTKDFMEILRDIAPESVREAERVLLETPEPD